MATARRMLDAETHRKFAGRKVDLLKIDCDGCEFTALRPWVTNVCTEQIVVEVHRFKGLGRRYQNVLNVHNLMMHLHAQGYRIAYLEANARYPILGTEYTLVRNRTCHHSVLSDAKLQSAVGLGLNRQTDRFLPAQPPMTRRRPLTEWSDAKLLSAAVHGLIPSIV